LPVHRINYYSVITGNVRIDHERINKVGMTTATTTATATTRTSTTTTTNRSTEMKVQKRPRVNIALESIKEQGQHILEATITDIQSKTNRRLLVEDEDHGPTDYQIKEANRVAEFVEQAIEDYTSKRGNVFCIMNEPIVIIDCEITEDLRQARVFWSLPYEILLLEDTKINAAMRAKLVQYMQRILEERGGVLQGMVHTKMRMYFRPPTIRFVPAEGEILRRALHDWM